MTSECSTVPQRPLKGALPSQLWADLSLKLLSAQSKAVPPTFLPRFLSSVPGAR